MPSETQTYPARASKVIVGNWTYILQYVNIIHIHTSYMLVAIFANLTQL